MDNYIEFIKARCKDLNDIYYRNIQIEKMRVFIAYNEALVDSNLISNYVIRSIVEILKDKSNEDTNNISLKEKIEKQLGQSNVNIENYIAINKIKKIEKESDDVFLYLMSGFVLLVLDNSVYVVEARGNLYRGISEPAGENSIRGAKDSFVESIIKNVGLIRNRIKTEELVYAENIIGKKTKTKFGIMYVNTIAKQDLVKYVEDKLKNIDIDGILDVSYIQEFIEEENEADFPVSITTERPDVVSYYLLQGRIVVLVDNSPYALILPAFFEDFFNNIDDYYQRKSNVFLTKIIRYICMILTVMTPAIYLSLITFDQESIPTDLLISFTSQREGVPFPAFVEAIIMIFAFEVLRESDLRSNKISGNTLSIVGALILGDAAVSAGIVSPIMIIVVALTVISGLTFQDINIINALRRWRIVFLIFSSLCGLVGIAIASTFYITSLVSTNSYTKSFTYPLAPLNEIEAKYNILSRSFIPKTVNRQKILTNNLTKLRR